jgi:flagellar protein FlbD
MRAFQFHFDNSTGGFYDYSRLLPHISLESIRPVADMLGETRSMIHVTRLNHTPVVLNCDLIEQIEQTPDTVISLTSGQKIMVLESTEEIIDSVRAFRQSILAPLDHSHGESATQKNH